MNSRKHTSGINFRQFSLPQVLKEVGKDLLIEFCAHFTSDLAAKNLTLPDPHLPDDDYFQSFARLLQCPALLPDTFKESLFDIEEMASPERADCLKEGVAEAALANMAVEGVCPERLALQLWLARPDLMLACQKSKTILTSFDGFARGLGQTDRAPIAPPAEATLEAMSAQMHLWFQQRNPEAPKVRIELYFNQPGEYWFLISHGDTCRWIYNSRTDQAELIHCRPDGEEALVCFGYEDQCWIAARTTAERDFYRHHFSLFLRGDADYFDQPCALTLEPLRINVADALDPRGLQGISHISLDQEEVEGGGGAYELTTLTAEKFFPTAKSRTTETDFIAKIGTLTRARFLVQFSDSPCCRVVEVCPPYTVRLERPSDLAAVARWVSKRLSLGLPLATPDCSKAA